MMSDSESKAATDLEERVQRLGRNEIAAVVMDVAAKTVSLWSRAGVTVS